MISPMDQVLVVGRRQVANDLLVNLQSLGVVQIDPFEPSDDLALNKLVLTAADKEQKDGWDALVNRLRGLIAALGVEQVEPASKTEVPGELEGLSSDLTVVAKQVDQLIAERADLQDEEELIHAYLPLYRDLAPTLAQLDNSQYLQGVAFAVPADAGGVAKQVISEALEDRVAFAVRPRGKEVLVVAAGLKKDYGLLKGAISQAGYAELSLPDRYASLGVAKAVHVMEERSQALPKRLDAIDQDLAKVSKQQGAKLVTMYHLSQNQQARYETLEDMASGRYSFAFKGWVPSSDTTKVVEGLKKQYGEDIIIETRHADEHHDHNVPVKLSNPSWVRPFEGLLSLFAPPKYGSFDPSWTLAIFFPLFFGMVVGDMGFGLMFALLALWLRRRSKQGKNLDLGPLGVVVQPGPLLPISTIIMWCAVWSIGFGFVFGEFFGNFLEYWPANNPIFYAPSHVLPGEDPHGIIPIILFRVEIFTPMLLASLGFGVLQVLGGWVIRIIYGFKHHDMKHVYEGVGMLAGLIGLIVYAAAFLTESLSPFVYGVFIVGMAIFLVCVVLSRVPLMLVELVSNGGNILSYLRIFAVGLSAALVANLATGLGFAVSGAIPVLGPILGIVIALAVHLFAIALTIIGHTLQPLRLNYVEFFTKFGFYDESGRPYKPFRLLGGKG